MFFSAVDLRTCQTVEICSFRHGRKEFQMLLNDIFIPAHSGSRLGFGRGKSPELCTAFLDERQQQSGIKTLFFRQFPGNTETEIGKVVCKNCRQMKFSPDSGVCFCDFI